MQARLTRTFAAVWTAAASRRYLLNLADDEITVRQRLERQALRAFLAVPDRRYRSAFAQLDGQTQAVAADSRARRGIVLAIGTLGPGGTERQFVGTLKGLKAAGQQVAGACVFLSTPAQRFFLPELEAAGIETHVFGDAPADALAPQLRSLIQALPSELHEIESYAATLSALRPAIAHLWLDDINVKGGIAAVLTGVPKIILSQRSLPPTNFGLHMPYMREAYLWLARQPGVVMLNNSAAGARAYESWLGLQTGSIGVVRNGLAFDAEVLAGYRAGRLDFRRRLGIDESVPMIGAVIRLTEEKRPFLWLEIASHIRKDKPDAQFLIVGDGPLRAQLETRAAEPDLAGAVHFAGHVQPALAAMAAIDMLLLTSRAEGLPNVLIEAQLLGVPAVASPVGGAVEAIDHGRSGWLLDNANPVACARIMTRLLDDAPWREAAARRGPDFVASRFGAERAISETLAAYGLARAHVQGNTHEHG